MHKLFKVSLSILLLLGTFFIPIKLVTAESLNPTEPLNIYLFYGEGCPHCAKERSFLNTLKETYKDQIKLNEFEIYYNHENGKVFSNVIEYFGSNSSGVPFLVIGEDYLVGYGSDDTTGEDILRVVKNCLVNTCSDTLSKFFVNNPLNETDNNTSKEEEDQLAEDVSAKKKESPIVLDTHIFGTVNLKNISLPLATILIALVDGFNPCAMWILIFLITMLINMKDRKRLYILGSVFILTSGFVYFIFLAAWFNFFSLIGYVYWIKVIIGIVAIVSGVLHIRSALQTKGECHATNESQRESIMDRTKRTLTQKHFLLALFGIMSLAVSVNLIEVVCSAGLPAVYTNLLSSIELSGLEYYAYLFLYVIIFMLDDLIIFFIAVKTFEVTGIAKKYTKWSSLVGGIIILIIGIILILKPELLMFG